MFIPLHDANRLRHIDRQYVTLGLIAANVACYLAAALGGTGLAQAAAYGLGFIPSIANGMAVMPPELALAPRPVTYVSYAFLHADALHLAANMLFLWVFGDNVEDAVGHVRFLALYLACAAAGALLHGIVAPASQMPLIGASGAVAGVVAAYLVLHPRVRIWVLAFARVPLRLPAFVVLGLWIAYQFVMLALDPAGQVSWAAHVGGIIAGAALVVILRRPGVPLFDRRIVTPRAVDTGPKIRLGPR